MLTGKFITENLIIENVSSIVQDVLLPIGGLYGKFDAISKDKAVFNSFESPNSYTYTLSKKDIIYLNPMSIDRDYATLIANKLKTGNQSQDFDEADIIDAVIFSPPYSTGNSVNYKQGLVYRTSPVDDDEELEAQYCYKKVKVIQGWPDLNEDIILPCIAINYIDERIDPFAIGSFVKNKTVTISIDTACESDGQRALINSILRSAFDISFIPLIDFRNGWPLTPKLEKNNLFSPSSNFLGYLGIKDFQIGNIPSISKSKNERYRSTGKLILFYEN